MNARGQFDLGEGDGRDGYTTWLAGRRIINQELARKLGLPLEHEVEVWLCGGVRLRGRLRLEEEMLIVDEERARHMRLRVDKVAFELREMESCVRLD